MCSRHRPEEGADSGGKDNVIDPADWRDQDGADSAPVDEAPDTVTIGGRLFVRHGDEYRPATYAEARESERAPDNDE